jgi:hypothetical protein
MMEPLPDLPDPGADEPETPLIAPGDDIPAPMEPVLE